MVEIIVSVKNGNLRGKIAKDLDGFNYYSFQGIPYAKPPLGPLRFKAPQSAEFWSGIRDATTNGNDSLCIDLRGNINGSEDCLFLNIYTRQLYSYNKSLKPVMFYLHGGGFVFGSGSSLVCGPQFLITKNVVVVTINYRLGLLGFLNFDDPSLDIPGNAGLKDQVMALRWVQENIKQFCGDPNNVTVFGGSAGAASIHYLMLSPLAKGLFHKAILQSGCAFSTWALGRPSFSSIKAALKMHSADEKEVFTVLQQMTPNELLDLQRKMPDNFEASFIRGMGPVIEKSWSLNPIITKTPEDIILSGDYNHVPFIIGFNSREGMITHTLNRDFKNYGPVVKDFESKIPHYMHIKRGSELSKNVAHKIQNFYYGREEPSQENRNQYYLIHGDNAFIWPAILTVTQHYLTSKYSIYLYRFSVDSNLNIRKFKDNPGVGHTEELGYLFKTRTTPKIIPNSVEDVSIKKLITLWTNFAKTGNPNPAETDLLINIHWKPIEDNKLHYLEIGENLTVGINPEENRIKFWKNLFKLSDTKCKL